MDTIKLTNGQIDAMLQKTVATMFPGETMWAVPWALEVDEERNCWLQGTASVDEEPGGTVRMQVHRGKDGYEVEVPRDYKWHPKRFDLIEDPRPIIKLEFYGVFHIGGEK